jgi:hypothetical protein
MINISVRARGMGQVRLLLVLETFVAGRPISIPNRNPNIDDAGELFSSSHTDRSRSRSDNHLSSTG